MSIEVVFGGAVAKICENGYEHTVRETYRDALEQYGVTFPDPELEKMLRLQDAHNALARDEVALDADGRAVDVSGFDPKAASEAFQANQVPLDNKTKLDSLTELALLSEAGTLASTVITAQRGERDATAVFVRAHTGLLKQFVQISMATEEWPDPWIDIVAKRFEGPITTFPLDQDDYQRGLVLMSEPFFKEVRRRHFGGLSLYRFNLRNALINQESQPEEIAESRCDIAAHIGLFYHHSPEAGEQMIAESVGNGLLASGGDWSQRIQDAVNYVRARTQRG